jgi:hypothetical protein
MGQGRGGFYTHEWIENLLGADIHNADRVVSAWQQLEVGDTVRLTPAPYFGQPGQLMTVADIQPQRALECFAKPFPTVPRRVGPFSCDLRITEGRVLS